MRSGSRALRIEIPTGAPSITKSKLPKAIEIRICLSVSSSLHRLIQSA